MPQAQEELLLEAQSRENLNPWFVENQQELSIERANAVDRLGLGGVQQVGLFRVDELVEDALDGHLEIGLVGHAAHRRCNLHATHVRSRDGRLRVE